MSDKAATPLKKLRESRGLTQSEVCEALKLDQTTFSKIETGVHAPRPDTAAAICKYFGPALNELHLIYPSRYPDYEVGRRK